MKNIFEYAAEEIALFCRLQHNSKRELPLRPAEMGVLILIHKNEEPVTPMMIGDFFQITKPSVSVMLKELIKGEYLEKRQSTNDGRSYLVSLTEKGEAVVLSAREEYYRAVALLREGLGEEEFDALVGLISRANQVLREARK